MKISSDHLINLITYATCKGNTINNEPIIEDTHIDVADYLDYYKKLFLNADNPYFGLYFGFFLNLKALGSVYEVSLSSSNIGQVVSMWSDYSKKNFPLVTFHSYIKNDLFILELASELENTTIKNQILDTIYTFVFRELKMMIGDKTPQIYLPYKNLEEYQAMFDCEVNYRKKHSFIFNKAILNQEINTHSKKIIEHLLPSFLLQLDNNKNDTFSSLVKQMILNMCHPDIPTLKQVAVQFSMTERTLQRRLKTEQTSFRNITNDIKRTLSKYLKKGNNTKTKEIAFMLGYASASAFLHAYKKW